MASHSNRKPRAEGKEMTEFFHGIATFISGALIGFGSGWWAALFVAERKWLGARKQRAQR
jgi:hypothetical protein